ncbi:MAG: Asp/Glu racemase [Pseudomonadota bacterium]
MSYAPYALTHAIGRRATLGLVMLSTDETVEHDAFRLCAGPDIALHTSRIALEPELTPETIARMEGRLAASAALLPSAAAYTSVAYACTSGTAHIGADRVAYHLTETTGTRHTTDPMTAALAGLHALGCSRIGLVSPYIDSVVAPLVRSFEAGGLTVVRRVSFGEQIEANVARIDPASILEAALTAGAAPEVDSVFLSCTNLRTLGILDEAETRLGKTVISSNQALVWHMLAQSGFVSAPTALRPGRLIRNFPPLHPPEKP